MDCISNGLDTATTYDILRSIRVLNHSLGTTNLISLLQVKTVSSCLYGAYLVVASS